MNSQGQPLPNLKFYYKGNKCEITGCAQMNTLGNHTRYIGFLIGNELDGIIFK